MEPAIWPPLEERELPDFTGVLVELLPLLGEQVRIEVSGDGEHTRAVLCGRLTPVGEAATGYAGFVVGDGALTVKEREFERGAVSIMATTDGSELRTVYLTTLGGLSLAIARDAGVASEPPLAYG